MQNIKAKFHKFYTDCEENSWLKIDELEDSISIRLLVKIIKCPIMMTGILINMIRTFWFIHF